MADSPLVSSIFSHFSFSLSLSLLLVPLLLSFRPSLFCMGMEHWETIPTSFGGNRPNPKLVIVARSFLRSSGTKFRPSFSSFISPRFLVFFFFLLFERTLLFNKVTTDRAFAKSPWLSLHWERPRWERRAERTDRLLSSRPCIRGPRARDTACRPPRSRCTWRPGAG